MDPDPLVPPRELWDFTGLHVLLCVGIKVIGGRERQYLDKTEGVNVNCQVERQKYTHRTHCDSI